LIQSFLKQIAQGAHRCKDILDHRVTVTEHPRVSTAVARQGVARIVSVMFAVLFIE
jgi:hypothetical protein